MSCRPRLPPCVSASRNATRAQWEQDIAAAWLAASFKLMQQERDANQGHRVHPVPAGARAADVVHRQLRRSDDPRCLPALRVVETLPRAPLRLGPEVLETLANRINDNRYHSLSAGTTLLALNAYIATTHADTAPQLAIRELLRDKEKTVRLLDLPATLMPKVPFSAAAKALRFTSGTDLNDFYLVNESGFDRTPPREAIVKGFEILREYTNAEGTPHADQNG